MVASAIKDLPLSFPEDSMVKWSNQFCVRGLKSGTNIWSGGIVVAILGPFFQLHQAQAYAKLSGAFEPPCCKPMMCSIWYSKLERYYGT